MKKILFLLITFFLVGCATANIEHLSANSNNKVYLPQNAKIFIALPEDGSYEGHKYEYSGKYVQDAFYNSFLRYNENVIAHSLPLSINEAYKQAQSMGANFFVYPRITHWEDRNTPWSGLRDKVEINVVIYSLGDGNVVDKTILYATNNWLTFVNYRPQKRLKTIIPPYVKSLYK